MALARALCSARSSARFAAAAAARASAFWSSVRPMRSWGSRRGEELFMVVGVCVICDL